MKKLVPLFLLAACVQVDLRARFSCDTAADCGAGYHCMPQFTGRGLCYLNAECNDAETCNGADDNCDGRVDETFPEKDGACTAMAFGPCATGANACALGHIVCQSAVSPVTESCDSIDNDCDGEVDETYDLTSDLSNCGMCGVICDLGTACRASHCVESDCDDHVDDDHNGLIDCDDPACLGQLCNATTAPVWHCGFRSYDGGVMQPDAGMSDAGDVDAGDLDAGDFDGGGVTDAGTPDAGWDGSPQRGCFPPESRCDDGRDEDGDGETDCEDDDCNGLQCASGNTCANHACPP